MAEDYRPEDYEMDEDYEMESWEKFLTEKEYMSLMPWGRRAAEYWTEFLPNMCREMKEEGTLLKELKKQGENLADYEEQLVRDGLAPDGVSELVWERVHAYQPEPDNLRLDEEDMKEILDYEMRSRYPEEKAYLPEEITTYEQYRRSPEYIALAKQELEWHLTPEEEKLIARAEERRWWKEQLEEKLWELYREDEEATDFDKFSSIPENIKAAEEMIEAEQAYYKELWDAGIREL